MALGNRSAADSRRCVVAGGSDAAPGSPTGCPRSLSPSTRMADCRDAASQQAITGAQDPVAVLQGSAFRTCAHASGGQFSRESCETIPPNRARKNTAHRKPAGLDAADPAVFAPNTLAIEPTIHFPPFTIWRTPADRECCRIGWLRVMHSPVASDVPRRRSVLVPHGRRTEGGSSSSIRNMPGHHATLSVTARSPVQTRPLGIHPVISTRMSAHRRGRPLAQGVQAHAGSSWRWSYATNDRRRPGSRSRDRYFRGRSPPHGISGSSPPRFRRPKSSTTPDRGRRFSISAPSGTIPRACLPSLGSASAGPSPH